MIDSRYVFFPQKQKRQMKSITEYTDIPLEEYLILSSQIDTLKTAVEQGLCDRGENLKINYEIRVGVDMSKMLRKYYPEEILKLAGVDDSCFTWLDSAVAFRDGKLNSNPIILLNLNSLVKDPACMLDSCVVEAVVKQFMIVKYVREYATKIEKSGIGGEKHFSSGFLFWCYFKASYMGRAVKLSIMKEYGIYSMSAGVLYDTVQVKYNLVGSLVKSKKDFFLCIAAYFGVVCAWEEMCETFSEDEMFALTNKLGFTLKMNGVYRALCNTKMSMLGMRKFEDVDLSDIDKFIYGDIDTEGIIEMYKEEPTIYERKC